MKKLFVFILCLAGLFVQPKALGYYKEAAYPPAEIETEVLLARIWVNEAGFATKNWRDHAGIAHVLRRVGKGEITHNAVCAYSNFTLCRPRRGKRRYINHLYKNGEQPKYWPSHLDWELYRKSWLKLIERSGQYMKRTPRACLDGHPYHWGAKGFRRDFWLSEGWRELNCPGAKNAFWAPPRR